MWLGVFTLIDCNSVRCTIDIYWGDFVLTAYRPVSVMAVQHFAD